MPGLKPDHCQGSIWCQWGRGGEVVWESYWVTLADWIASFTLMCIPMKDGQPLEIELGVKRKYKV